MSREPSNVETQIARHLELGMLAPKVMGGGH
jgi:hypothetical protein